MIRLIGILTGSAVAISFLIIALGVPELVTRQEADSGPAPPALVNEPNLPMAAAEPVTVPVALPHQETLPASEQESPPETEPEPVQVAEQDSVAVDAETPDAALAPQRSSAGTVEPDAAPVPDIVPAPNEQNWYAFWSPFRSEIAADGFIAQLQRTTGLDYRVVKLKPGIYEVAFAYSDDTDIAEKLAQISAATGLEMTGG